MNITPLVAFTMIAVAGHSTAAASEITVPGGACPALAGMPERTSGCGAPDQAPEQSPIEVTGVAFAPGDALSFTAFGFTCHCGGCCSTDPDGGGIYCFSCNPMNGISVGCVPLNALTGVFLGPEAPHLTPAPPPLDFTTPESHDYLRLAPQLKQVFFIGDGQTSVNQVQQVIAPAGATRLFLGSHDGFGWYDNTGEMRVVVEVATTCARGDVDCNGIVNIDDLVSVITSWGPCQKPPDPCIADIAPTPNGNGAVDIDDLVSVIIHWGS